MDPFTTFPYLRQAFTEGERWPVSELRLMRLVQSGKLSKAQAHFFRMQGGAIGSHLENLERNDGYKGFNQKGVSDICCWLTELQAYCGAFDVLQWPKPRYWKD